MVSAWFIISVDSCSISLYWALPFMVFIRRFFTAALSLAFRYSFLFQSATFV